MANYILNLVTIDDDGGSYDRAWHITESVAENVLHVMPSPHGEWLFTKEDNEKRKRRGGGGIGIIHDGES